MSDQDKINAIIAAIQDDTKLMEILKLIIAANLPNVPSDRLSMLYNALGLNQ